MKNPFIQAAILMATMASAMKENAMRNFYGKSFVGHVGSSGASRNKRPFCSAGGKLFKKANKNKLGMRHHCSMGAPGI